jgi:hypothetical protein
LQNESDDDLRPVPGFRFEGDFGRQGIDEFPAFAGVRQGFAFFIDHVGAEFIAEDVFGFTADPVAESPIAEYNFVVFIQTEIADGGIIQYSQQKTAVGFGRFDFIDGGGEIRDCPTGHLSVFPDRRHRYSPKIIAFGIQLNGDIDVGLFHIFRCNPQIANGLRHPGIFAEAKYKIIHAPYLQSRKQILRNSVYEDAFAVFFEYEKG